MKKIAAGILLLGGGAMAAAGITGTDTTVTDSVILMNASGSGAETTEITDDATGFVMEEKIAIDPMYRFSGEEEVMYTKTDMYLSAEPRDGSDNVGMLIKGQQIKKLGENENGYLKIEFEGKEGFIKNENLAWSSDEVFFDCYEVKYTSDEVVIYEDISGDAAYNVIGSIEKYGEIDVIGKNDSNIVKVKKGDLEGYASKDLLLEYMPQEAYITTGFDGVTKYHSDNMYNGVLASVDESQKTEENLQYLAKLIHCEAGGQNEEGKLAVATVVVNRAYDGSMGNTIESVINRPSQFSPVSTGKINRFSYTQDDYDAAYKVLIEGYRSFPAYVMYFQSHNEGYFGDNAYCTTYTSAGTHPQYFSFKTSDLQKYMTDGMLGDDI